MIDTIVEVLSTRSLDAKGTDYVESIVCVEVLIKMGVGPAASVEEVLLPLNTS